MLATLILLNRTVIHLKFFDGLTFSFLCPMAAAQILFYVSFFVLFYTYVGYGLFVWVCNSISAKQKPVKIFDAHPAVTLIIPAYNEADWIRQKVENCRQLNYPKDKLNILFITDGSDDLSNDRLAKYPGIITMYLPERKGKMAAINRCMLEVKTPIVVFSDANTLLNDQCMYEIVKHYQDVKVGGVAGEKKIYTSRKQSVIGFGEGLYWKYESMLKQLDSDFNTVVGAAGELFSMRTELFTPQPDSIILDDFILSMRLCIEGYKVVYEPNAYAVESPSINITEEKKRRVRIAAGAFQTIALLWQHMSIVKMPLLCFQYVSRRLLRWIACPLCLVLLYCSNIYIILQPGSANFFEWFFVAQNIFYAVAIVGGFLYQVEGTLNLFFIPFYFVFMNALLFEGFFKYVTGSQSVLWEKSKRSVAPAHTGAGKYPAN